jgi:hypothetical protein
MKKFKERKKQKEGKIRHHILEEIFEFIIEGILGLLWRLVAGSFHIIVRLIAAIFHHI